MAKVFALEALDAKHGDALLLHHGTEAKPRLIVIDGGPRGVWTRSLSPRLEELRAERGSPLKIDGIMVSHVDDDHICGILDMTAKIEKRLDDQLEARFEVAELWFNAFDDVLGNVEAAVFQRPDLTAGLPANLHDAVAVVASVGQGRALRDRASRLGLRVNGDRRLLQGGDRFAVGAGLEFLVVGPEPTRVAEFQTAWDEKVEEEGWDAEPAAAEVAAYLDDSVWNLASIVVLAKSGSRRMLLTGDARGDDILSGLRAAGLLSNTGLDLDLLKVPHHGSDRNVSTEFFRRVRADHYVISGNGEHGNPDIATLQMILDARGDAAYTIHCTYREGIKGHKAKVAQFLASLSASRRKRFAFRDPNELSLRIDLA